MHFAPPIVNKVGKNWHALSYFAVFEISLAKETLEVGTAHII